MAIRHKPLQKEVNKRQQAKLQRLADRLIEHLELESCEFIWTQAQARKHGFTLNRNCIAVRLVDEATYFVLPSLRKDMILDDDIYQEGYYFGLITRRWLNHLINMQKSIVKAIQEQNRGA